jgi:hypothetical protein
VEPEVEGVEHRAHQRDGEVGLEMAVVIPAEGRDAIAGADAEGVKRPGKAAGALQALGVRGAVDGVVGAAAHDRAITEECLCPARDGGDREGVVHREA